MRLSIFFEQLVSALGRTTPAFTKREMAPAWSEWPALPFTHQLTAALGRSTAAWRLSRASDAYQASAVTNGSDEVNVGGVHVSRPTPQFDADRHGAALNVALGAVSLDALHYLALYEDKHMIFEVDVFDELSNAVDSDPHDLRVIHRAYRPLFDLVGREVISIQRSPGVERGNLIRLVVDLQRGAVFFFLVTAFPLRYAVGATLDQAAVNKADTEMMRATGALWKTLAPPTAFKDLAQ